MQDFLGHMSDGGGESQYMDAVEARFDRDAGIFARLEDGSLKDEHGVYRDRIARGPRAPSVHFDYHSQNGGEFGPVVKVKWVREDADAMDEDEMK